MTQNTPNKHHTKRWYSRLDCGSRIASRKFNAAQENRVNAMNNMEKTGLWEVVEPVARNIGGGFFLAIDPRQSKLRHVPTGQIYNLEEATRANTKFKQISRVESQLADEQYLESKGWTRLQHGDWSRLAPNGKNLIYATRAHAVKMQYNWDRD